MVILLAAFMLLDRSFSSSASIADRQDGLQRGRQAMELMTRQLRSQVCVVVPPATGYSGAGGLRGHRHRRDLLRQPQREQHERREADADVLEHGYRLDHPERDHRDAEHGLPADGLHGRGHHHHAAHERQAGRETAAATRPVFRYYRYKPGAPVGDLEQLTAPVAAANLPSIALIKVAFRAYAARPISNDNDATQIEDDVYIRISDSSEQQENTTVHLIHRCQQGFTTVTLMGVLMVGGLLVAASFAAVDPDLGLTKKDDDSKQAYAAAEAGHQLLPQPPGAGHGLLHALRRTCRRPARTR